MKDDASTARDAMLKFKLPGWITTIAPTKPMISAIIRAGVAFSFINIIAKMTPNSGDVNTMAETSAMVILVMP